MHLTSKFRTGDWARKVLLMTVEVSWHVWVPSQGKPAHLTLNTRTETKTGLKYGCFIRQHPYKGSEYSFLSGVLNGKPCNVERWRVWILFVRYPVSIQSGNWLFRWKFVVFITHSRVKPGQGLPVRQVPIVSQLLGFSILPGTFTSMLLRPGYHKLRCSW
jgi:hypothetical protein